MAHCFMFTRPNESEPTPLGIVEREFLVEFGLESEINDKRWHPIFDIIQQLAATGAGTAERLDQFFGRVRGCEKTLADLAADGLEINKFESTIRKFMLGDRFQAHAWREFGR